MVEFYAILDRVLDLLKRRGRVTYRALKRQFDLTDAFLEDLKAEIIEAQQVAFDEDGKVLVWTGDTASSPLPTAPPVRAPAQAPLSYTPQYLAERILTSRSV